MKAIVALAAKIGPTAVPVLIAGETGSGKEIVAELIHANSDRKSKSMVCINCAGLPAELIESELFGSAKGSFTGGIDRIGLFKHANLSTVFLDELSEMPLHLQAKLLRFIQYMRIRRVGSIGEETVDVRVVAAINRSPAECVRDKRLREDLYYRLSTVTITVPPLRDRPEDILPLAAAYLDFFSAQFKRKPPQIEKITASALMNYGWPGNVRQLQNEMNRCALLCNGSVDIDDLSVLTGAPTDEGDLQHWTSRNVEEFTSLEKAEAQAIIRDLIASKWNMRRTASTLGIGRQTLYNKLSAYGIKTLAGDAQLVKRTLRRTAPSDLPADPAPSPSPPPAPEHNGERLPESSASASPVPQEEGLLD